MSLQNHELLLQIYVKHKYLSKCKKAYKKINLITYDHKIALTRYLTQI